MRAATTVSNDSQDSHHTILTGRLISSAPSIALLDQWEMELSILGRRSPSSDAQVTLSTCVRELRASLKAGDDTKFHLTTAEARAHSGIPVSTLRWLCKQKAKEVGAQKHEGVWYLERQRFERYLQTSNCESNRTCTSGEISEIRDVDAA